MNKMKNFTRRFSLSVPRTETIEESITELTEQYNQKNSRHSEEAMTRDERKSSDEARSATYQYTRRERASSDEAERASSELFRLSLAMTQM